MSQGPRRDGAPDSGQRPVLTGRPRKATNLTSHEDTLVRVRSALRPPDVIIAAMSADNDQESEPHVEYDPRVNLVDAATGEVTPVAKDEVDGLDSFIAGWESNVSMPHALDFSAWQMVDEEHPAGAGRPAYRLVHKSIRTVFWPGVLLEFPNLRVEFGNGSLTYGEPLFKGTLRGRRAGTFLLPEWGLVSDADDGSGSVGYQHHPDMHLQIEGHQETTPPGNYVEFLYELPPGDWQSYEAMRSAGRAGVATLTAMIDLLYGERVLGPVLTEEVGEVFDDWHWNRRLGGRTVSMETQAQLEQRDSAELASQLGSAIDMQLARVTEMRNRLRVASQWYWSGQAEGDPVQRYMHHWLVVEALELEQNSGIRPLKQVIRTMLSTEASSISDVVGRLYGVRNGLMHGEIREVSKAQLHQVEVLADALLEYRSLERLSQFRRAALAEVMQVDLSVQGKD